MTHFIGIRSPRALIHSPRSLEEEKVNILRLPSMVCLVTAACSTEPPDVVVSVPASIASTVPLAAAVSYKGDASKLRYTWEVSAGCATTTSSANTSSTVVTVGSDCAGKALAATVRVSYPGGSVEKSVNLMIPAPPPPNPPPSIEPQITITSPHDGVPTAAAFLDRRHGCSGGGRAAFSLLGRHQPARRPRFLAARPRHTEPAGRQMDRQRDAWRRPQCRGGLQCLGGRR